MHKTLSLSNITAQPVQYKSEIVKIYLQNAPLILILNLCYYFSKLISVCSILYNTKHLLLVLVDLRRQKYEIKNFNTNPAKRNITL